MPGSTNDGYYEALWPRSPRQAKTRPLSARLGTFEGRKIAWVWDYLFRGDEVFAALEDGIRARFPGAQFIDWREFGNTHGSDERAVVAALGAKLKSLGADAVVSGMGC
jgi:hypothetical protein